VYNVYYEDLDITMHICDRLYSLDLYTVKTMTR